MSSVPARKHRSNPLQPHVSGSDPYYNFIRPDAEQALKEAKLQPKRLLEVGCAAGAFVRDLKKSMPLEYCVGIEGNAEAAALARQHFNEVHVGNLDQMDFEKCGMKKESFDLLAALDVLEHLYDPWETLAKLVEYVRPGGHVIVSIPNTQNLDVVIGLLNGQWQYQSKGLLDATHIRFFTWNGIGQLLSGVGLSLVHTLVTFTQEINQANMLDKGNVIELGRFKLTDLTREEVMRFCAHEYIVVAQKAAIPAPGAFVLPPRLT